MFPSGDVSNLADHIFDAYDMDGNGMVDFKEFLCTVNLATNGTVDEKLKWAFRLYDIDDNGYVTKEEVIQFVKVSE